jgi:hypothetical protein
MRIPMIADACFELKADNRDGGQHSDDRIALQLLRLRRERTRPVSPPSRETNSRRFN